MTLAPRHILVTGGSRGLGLAIVRRLLAGNYKVTSLSRSVSEEFRSLLAEYPERLFWLSYDASTETQHWQLMRKVEEHGPLYALINNSAIANDDLLISLPQEKITEAITVNLTSTILLSRAAAKSLVRSRLGRIITISSILARRGVRGLSVYAATKAAMEGFSRCLAMELGPRNITVNVVAPGYIDTDMTRTLSPEQRGRVRRRAAILRDVSAEDVAQSIYFLLSEEAGTITGITLTIDGGSSL